jgi:GrpB-like predicted nucleotidyltransferase (UPF0157 family)
MEITILQPLDRVMMQRDSRPAIRMIVVVDYDAAWPSTFETLRSRAWEVVADFALSIEHVGSTSVPGLAAKPIIDMSVVVRDPVEVPLAINRLATVGYVHRGDRGVEGREAFYSPAGLPAHHLYVCQQGSPALANHLAVREYLQTHPTTADAYARLKRRLAQEFVDDIDGYVDGKTSFLLAILREAGFSLKLQAAIDAANRKK